MKCSSTIGFAAAFLSVCTESLQLHKRTDGPAKVVALPIERKGVKDPLLRDKLRKRATQQVTLDNLGTLYFANGTLGTPAQPQRLHLDTGSSDLWVNTPTSALCKDTRDPCRYAGSYSANASSTYQYIASDFNISYVDGSGGAGDYVSDTFTLGGTTLDQLQFGVGYSSSAFEGILGIGYPVNEVQVGRAGKKPYDNLPAKMATDKLISSNAYSIWLNDLEASMGSILFGGVDTGKYKPPLETLPIQKTRGIYSEFLITLTALSFGDTLVASNQAQAVLLDTGSSLTYLPSQMVAALYEIVDAQYDNTQGAAYVPCSLRSNKTTIDFTFSGPKISVDLTELVIGVQSTSGQPLTFSDGTPACLFGIAPAGTSTSVLGDTFLRSAYVVYDLENNQISIAATNFDSTKSNIMEISGSVPGATAVSDPVEASGVVGGGGRIGGTSTMGLGNPSQKAGVGRVVVSWSLVGLVGLGMVLIVF